MEVYAIACEMKWYHCGLLYFLLHGIEVRRVQVVIWRIS
jgi:hypothetical protein